MRMSAVEIKSIYHQSQVSDAKCSNGDKDFSGKLSPRKFKPCLAGEDLNGESFEKPLRQDS